MDHPQNVTNLTCPYIEERWNRCPNTTSPTLRALFLNCTLKPSSAELSNTQALMDNSIAIMRANGVAVDKIRRSTTRSRPASSPT